MLTLIAQIALVVWGIIVLVRGQVAFSQNRIVLGAKARIIGALLILPWPLAIGIAMVYAMVQVAGGKEIEEKSLTPAATLILIGSYAACLLTAIILGMLWGNPRKARLNTPVTLDAEEERLLEYGKEGRMP